MTQKCARVIAGELRKGARWLAGQICDHAGDRLGRAAYALVCSDCEQAVDEPPWLASFRETGSRLVERLVNETQRPANRLAQDGRRLPVGEGFTPSDHVLPPGMPWLGQCDDGDRGDIPGINERNPAVAGGGVDDPIVDDVVSLAQEVLHEMTRPQHRPRQS